MIIHLSNLSTVVTCYLHYNRGHVQLCWQFFILIFHFKGSKKKKKEKGMLDAVRILWNRRNIRKKGVFSILLTYNDKQESSLRGKNGVKMA